MSEQLLRKIKEYKDELTFDFDKRNVEVWEKEIKKAIQRKKIAEMSPIKELLGQLADKVRKAEWVLLNDREITDEERKRIFDRIDVYKWFLSFFGNADLIIKKVEKFLEEENK